MIFKIGIDFDNTIISYANIFYQVCYKKNLVPRNIKRDKENIKRYVVNQNGEKAWTLLQGEIYGKYIRNI